MKQSFAPNDLNTNTRIMASYLPPGKAFEAGAMSGSNFNKLMHALAVEFGRNQEILSELAEQHDISNTVNLLEEWESALGIPDDCFDTTGTIEQRQKKCVAKFAKMNIAIYNDWIYLADFLGYNITIEYGSKYMVLPFILPFILGDAKTAKFTIIINFIDLPSPTCVLPLTLPFTLGDGGNTLKCIFEHLKPANVRIIYKYLG
jgi:uncharacterized protein YmfQ (DUF2313 family)